MKGGGTDVGKRESSLKPLVVTHKVANVLGGLRKAPEVQIAVAEDGLGGDLLRGTVFMVGWVNLNGL